MNNDLQEIDILYHDLGRDVERPSSANHKSKSPN